MRAFTSTVVRLVVVLLILELIARVAATVKNDFNTDPPQWYEYSSTLGWIRAPNFKGTMECGVSRDFDSRGYRSADTEQIDDHSQSKIVFLGDSTTMGFCVETEDSFVELLDAKLTNATAINLGLNGYSSHQGYQTLLEAGDTLQPDVIVASFNFNDRRYLLDPSQADGPAAFDAALRSDSRRILLRTLERSYLVGGLRFALRSMGLIRDPVIPSTVDLGSLQTRVTLEQYKENLANIVRWGRENDSEVVFMVLGDNPARTARLQSAVEHIRAGSLDAAMEELWVVRRDEWFSDLARLQQAQVYRARGGAAEAERVTKAESYWSMHGGRPIVLDDVYNAAMREVAREFDVEVIEARSVLDQYPGIFIDNAHFDARGHAILADVLAGPIAGLLETRSESK